MEYQVYKDTAGYYRWRLLADNSKKIADGAEGYNNKVDCLAGIALVKKSSTTPIKDLT